MPNDTNETTNKKAALLLELKKVEIGGCVSVACRNLGLSRATIYRWRRDDPQFAQDWKEAVIDGEESILDHVEHALYRVATAGNVTAMIFALKNRRPDRWKDVRDFAFKGELEVNLRNATDGELIKRATALGIDTGHYLGGGTQATVINAEIAGECDAVREGDLTPNPV